MKYNDPNHRSTSIIEARRKLASANLKCCPVCEALNSAANIECFVCRWHGTFVHDPEAIENGLLRLLSKCPDYTVRPVPTPQEPPKTKGGKWKLLLKRLLKGPVDFTV